MRLAVSAPARVAGAVAATTAATALALLPSAAFAVAADNGTVKVHDATTGEELTKNEPHVCTFYLDAFFFDAEQKFSWEIQVWAPGDDDKGTVVKTGGLVGDKDGHKRTEDIALPDGHYKLFWNFAGEKGAAKHKVFWVECEKPGGTTGETTGGQTTGGQTTGGQTAGGQTTGGQTTGGQTTGGQTTGGQTTGGQTTGGQTTGGTTAGGQTTGTTGGSAAAGSTTTGGTTNTGSGGGTLAQTGGFAVGGIAAVAAALVGGGYLLRRRAAAAAAAHGGDE
ncbi:hypothetical protein [Yinghuangia seranimata]|uniref:hypothetical protein n=1 Tax=Yinghuangia seranimata TaxID=408067 RepID=UPI00248ACDDE|nr:hypothetical protein [Yinghuangia seranimata]MDI2132314.1 hypothetical protein [Yinghuangia seranimata]